MEMNRKFLEDLGLEKEVVDKVMAEHGKTLQTTKAELDNAKEELNSANETLETLKEENKDVETLQSKISEHEATVTKLQEELSSERKTFAIKEALTGAGASDVDYMMFKLGEVEVDEEGKVKDLDNKIKELQESNPTFFTTTKEDDDAGNDNLGGFQVLDNKLENGKQPDPAEAVVTDFETALGITQE